MIKRLIIMLLVYSATVFCQPKIVGTWQENDTLVAAGLKDTYRFFDNGNFEFWVSTFNYLSKLQKLNGQYKIESDIIVLNVKNIVEIVDGELSFGDESTDYNNWTFINSRILSKNLIKPKIFKVKFDHFEKSNIIKIDYKEFYKISDDPKAYED